MQYRALGRTDWQVSDISFGAWAIGGSWGKVSDDESWATLHKAVQSGVNFIDTADVYGDGRSEMLIAKFKKERKEDIIVATKAGRRLPKQTEAGYSRENLTTNHWSFEFPLAAIPENAKPPVPIAGHRRLASLSVLTGKLTSDHPGNG
jgi:aryl-alcohol dehydrogenase-like predicted oxidoreductase